MSNDPCINYASKRLQAQGTAAHPYRYTSAWDVASKTYKADGVRGFYKGLGPTLFKVKNEPIRETNPLIFCFNA